MTAFRQIPDVAVGKSFIVLASVGPNCFDRLLMIAFAYGRCRGASIAPAAVMTIRR
jgi:hypothetical protein